MTDRLLKLLLAVTGLAVLGVQIWMTDLPDAKEIRDSVARRSHESGWVGRTGPEIEVPMLDGSTFRVADHVGQRVIVLNFFATWCGPCRAEMPELLRFTQALQESKLPYTFLAIDVEERRDAVEKFINDLKLAGMPIGLDESGALAKRFDVSAFPTTVVIGGDGTVKLYETGAISNADVSLMPVMVPEFARVRNGKGVTLAAYHEAAVLEAKQPHPAAQSASEKPDEPALDGRAKHIADTMTCPCGCADTVSHCGCHTAKNIKAKLRAEFANPAGAFAQQSDAEIKTALNREFCMKDM